MGTRISYLEKKYENKSIYTPCIIFRAKVGEYLVKILYRKIAGTIEIFVEIDGKSMGATFFKSREAFIKLGQSLSGLSESPFYPIAKGVSSKKTFKDIDKLKEMSCDEIEEKITFFTLYSIIELGFPTNWLILLQ